MKTILKKYKHIIWDWNGTLFNDVNLCCDIINNILIENDLCPLSIERYKEIFTFPVKEYYRKAGLDFEKISFEELGKQFMDEYEKRKLECKLYEDADNFLNEILKMNIEQSVLSAYSQKPLENLITHYGIRKYFIGFAGLDNIYANGKVELGKRWVKKLNLEKGEAVLIGDTLHDFDVANEIGADCILIANGHQQKEILLNSGTQVLDSLKDLINGK